MEAHIRAIQVQDQWTAAKILAMVKEGVDKQVDYTLFCPKVINLSCELNNFQMAKHELQEYFEKVMENPSTKRKVRLRARLKHWLFRLSKVKDIIDNNELQQVTEIETFFQELLERLNTLPTRDEFEGQFKQLVSNAEVETNILSQDVSFAGPEEDLRVEQQTLDRENFHVGNVEMTQLDECKGPLLLDKMFQYEITKLPNPISAILQQAREFSVNNYPSILQFLNSFTKLKWQAKLLRIHDLEILKMIYPYTRGILVDFVVQAIESSFTLGQFHSECLAAYLPLTVISRFINQYVLRPQYKGEPLTDYIQQVRLHSDMFNSAYSESQLVEIILMNANRAEVRSLHLSSSAPKTFSELFLISNRMNQCDSGEMLRAVPSTPPF